MTDRMTRLIRNIRRARPPGADTAPADAPVVAQPDAVPPPVVARTDIDTMSDTDPVADALPEPVMPATPAMPMMFLSPFDGMKSGFELARLAVESQAVVTMRLMGMGGAWNTPFDETYRMWREKPAAFAESAGRGVEAALNGQPPDRVMSAMVAPLSRDAASNRERLAQRGARKRG